MARDYVYGFIQRFLEPPLAGYTKFLCRSFKVAVLPLLPPVLTTGFNVIFTKSPLTFSWRGWLKNVLAIVISPLSVVALYEEYTVLTRYSNSISPLKFTNTPRSLLIAKWFASKKVQNKEGKVTATHLKSQVKKQNTTHIWRSWNKFSHFHHLYLPSIRIEQKSQHWFETRPQ